MAGQRGTLENIALGLSSLLYPLSERLESGNARLLFADSACNSRLAEFEALIDEYDALDPGTADEIRFNLLARAELLVTTQATAVLPPDPDDLRATLVNVTQPAFLAKRNDLAALLNTGTPSVSGLYADLQALLPLTDFDTAEMDFEVFRARIVAFADEMRVVATTAANEADRRSAAAQSLLDAHDSAATPSEQVRAVQGAAKALLGDDFP